MGDSVNPCIPVGELLIGMYVAELDRPWLGTPFLLQGFLIEDAGEIAQLQSCCQSVFVDPSRSTGIGYKRLAGYLSPQPARPAARPAGAPVPRPGVAVVAAPNVARGSLLGGIKSMLRESLNPKQQAAASPHPTGGAVQRVATITREQPKPRPAPKRDAGSAPPASKYISKDYRLLSSAAAGARDRDVAYGDVGIVAYNDTVTLKEELPQAKLTHSQGSAMIAELLRDMRKDFVFEIDRINTVVDDIVDSMVRNPEAMIWLTRLKSRDDHAYDHALDSSVYMIAFGRHLGFPKPQLENFGVCGLLLDIGKIKISEELMKKTAKLDPEELETVRSHVNHGIEIVMQENKTPLEVVDAIATHHERYDGSGYPAGLSGDQIGMVGAMAGIVDTFAAMTRKRPYAAASSAQHVLQEMYRWRDTLFPAAMIEQFIQCIGLFPAGSLVELNSGEVAIVVSQNRLLRLKPKILMILDPQKQPYKGLRAMDLRLNPNAPDGSPYHIVRSVAPTAYGIDPSQYYLLEAQ